jgi:hypothetical protein
MLGNLRTHSHANKKQTSLCDKSEFHSQHWQSSCIWSMLDSIELWAFDNSWFKNEIQNSEKCDFWGFQSPKWGNKKKINHYIWICDFHCVTKHIEEWLKISISFLFIVQLWPNLPKGKDNHKFSTSSNEWSPLASKEKFQKITLELVRWLWAQVVGRNQWKAAMITRA